MCLFIELLSKSIVLLKESLSKYYITTFLSLSAFLDTPSILYNSTKLEREYDSETWFLILEFDDNLRQSSVPDREGLTVLAQEMPMILGEEIDRYARAKWLCQGPISATKTYPVYVELKGEEICLAQAPVQPSSPAYGLYWLGCGVIDYSTGTCGVLADIGKCLLVPNWGLWDEGASYSLCGTFSRYMEMQPEASYCYWARPARGFPKKKPRSDVIDCFYRETEKVAYRKEEGCTGCEMEVLHLRQ